MAINNPKKKLQATIVMLKGEKGDKGDQGLGGGTWGGIEGDITNQTDLQTALDAKANATEVLDALTLKANTEDVNDALSEVNDALALKANTSDVNNALALKANTEDVNNALATKQNTLTFDNVPTAGSNNPVKSSGIYTAIANLKLTKIWSADSYPPEPIDYPLTISLPSGSDRLLIEYVPNGYRNVSKYILVSRQNLTDSFEISETSLSGTNQLTVYTRKVTGLSSGLRFELANHYMGLDETAENSILPYAIYKVGDIYNS